VKEDHRLGRQKGSQMFLAIAGLLLMILSGIFGTFVAVSELLGVFTGFDVHAFWNMIACMFLIGTGSGALFVPVSKLCVLMEPFFTWQRWENTINRMKVEQGLSQSSQHSVAALSRSNRAWERARDITLTQYVLGVGGLAGFLFFAMTLPRFMERMFGPLPPTPPACTAKVIAVQPTPEAYFDVNPKMAAIYPQPEPPKIIGLALFPGSLMGTSMLGFPCLARTRCVGSIAWLLAGEFKSFQQPIPCRAINPWEFEMMSSGGIPTCMVF
jgi:hypothetical protein